MKRYKSQQELRQLEKRKGGYFFLSIDPDIVTQFKNGKKTRLVCTVDKALTFPCGLNPMGNGTFFIILSTKNVKKLGKTIGDIVAFELREDPNPLGVELPEVLTALIEQDEDLKKKFEVLTDGKKRSLVYAIIGIKDLDKQVKKIIELLNNGVKLRTNVTL